MGGLECPLPTPPRCRHPTTHCMDTSTAEQVNEYRGFLQTHMLPVATESVLRTKVDDAIALAHQIVNVSTKTAPSWGAWLHNLMTWSSSPQTPEWKRLYSLEGRVWEVTEIAHVTDVPPLIVAASHWVTCVSDTTQKIIPVYTAELLVGTRERGAMLIATARSDLPPTHNDFPLVQLVHTQVLVKTDKASDTIFVPVTIALYRRRGELRTHDLLTERESTMNAIVAKFPATQRDRVAAEIQAIVDECTDGGVVRRIRETFDDMRHPRVPMRDVFHWLDANSRVFPMSAALRLRRLQTTSESEMARLARALAELNL
jgi:hypothetical protein